MISCEYSYARDCSECNEPYCRRDHYHSPNDWDADSDHADAAFLDCMTHDHYSSLFMEDLPD